MTHWKIVFTEIGQHLIIHICGEESCWIHWSPRRCTWGGGGECEGGISAWKGAQRSVGKASTLSTSVSRYLMHLIHPTCCQCLMNRWKSREVSFMDTWRTVWWRSHRTWLVGARLIAPAETLENQLNSGIQGEGREVKEGERNQRGQEGSLQAWGQDYTVISWIQLWDLFDRKKLCFCSQ